MKRRRENHKTQTIEETKRLEIHNSGRDYRGKLAVDGKFQSTYNNLAGRKLEIKLNDFKEFLSLSNF